LHTGMCTQSQEPGPPRETRTRNFLKQTIKRRLGQRKTKGEPKESDGDKVAAAVLGRERGSRAGEGRRGAPTGVGGHNGGRSGPQVLGREGLFRQANLAKGGRRSCWGDAMKRVPPPPLSSAPFGCMAESWMFPLSRRFGANFPVSQAYLFSEQPFGSATGRCWKELRKKRPFFFPV